MAIHLGDYVLLGKGEEATGGRRRLSTLGGRLRSADRRGVSGRRPVPAARAGAATCSKRKSAIWYPVRRSGIRRANSRNCLQAIHPQAPCYRIIGESGPDHRRVFQSEVFWQTFMLATGKGKSKKEAEARAAAEALRARVWEKS